MAADGKARRCNLGAFSIGLNRKKTMDCLISRHSIEKPACLFPLAAPAALFLTILRQGKGASSPECGKSLQSALTAAQARLFSA
jgi:hypothetical protein